MKRAGLYSSSRRKGPAAPPPPPAPVRKAFPWKKLGWPAFAALLLVLAVSGWMAPRGMLKEEVDAAIAKAAAAQEAPFSAAEAYEKILPSIVLVRGLGAERDDGYVKNESTGTGVVIV